MIFLSGALVPISLLLSLIVENPIPMLIPLALFFLGLVLMLYSRIFAEEIAPPKSRQARPHTPGTAPKSTALPPAHNIRMNNVNGQRVRTTELAQPSSVTEHTTKLLNTD